MKDVKVLNGFSGIHTTWTTCSRHNTNQVIVTSILLIRVVAAGGTFWLLVPCMRKVHTRPALTWTAVSTITEFRSHQQALGNQPWLVLWREHVIQVVLIPLKPLRTFTSFIYWPMVHTRDRESKTFVESEKAWQQSFWTQTHWCSCIGEVA